MGTCGFIILAFDSRGIELFDSCLMVWIAGIAAILLALGSIFFRWLRPWSITFSGILLCAALYLVVASFLLFVRTPSVQGELFGMSVSTVLLPALSLFISVLVWKKGKRSRSITRAASGYG